jgi:hypothetical protein
LPINTRPRSFCVRNFRRGSRPRIRNKRSASEINIDQNFLCPVFTFEFGSRKVVGLSTFVLEECQLSPLFRKVVAGRCLTAFRHFVNRELVMPWTSATAEKNRLIT